MSRGGRSLFRLGLQAKRPEYVLAQPSNYLWVGSSPVPPSLREAAGGSWELHAWSDGHLLAPRLEWANVAVVHPNGQSHDLPSLRRLLDAIARSHAVGVFLLPPHAAEARELLARSPCLCVDEAIAPRELAGRLLAAAQLQPVIRDLRTEVNAVRGAAPPAPGQWEEEMRLAARIQRDFLPRRLPEMGPLRFGALFRPAGWLSGDIYDVMRLDETHVGFYVADAVGHGMPAALLTMFIKKALQTKRIVGQRYEIVPPHAALSELNQDICQQNLTSCHFCTAVYAVLDVRTLLLTYCRAGHPEPILLRADGSVRRLAAPGSLLGILPEETFESRHVQLAPGDRLVFYTDGAEEVLRLSAGPEVPLEHVLARWAAIPKDDMLLGITGLIDGLCVPGRHDDITLLTLDIER